MAADHKQKVSENPLFPFPTNARGDWSTCSRRIAELSMLLDQFEGSQLNFNHHQSLRDLEHDVPTEILPGTEIMGDVGDYHFTKRGRNNTVLVPQPSNDPNDPLVGSFVVLLTEGQCAHILVLTIIELEPTVEAICHGVCYNCNIRSRHWTPGKCAHISSIDSRIPLRPCGRCAIYRSHYPSPGI